MRCPLEDCWFANPDDVVDYVYMRRHTRIEAAGDAQFVVRVEGLPEEVMRRELTFEVLGAGTPEAARLAVDGIHVKLFALRPGVMVGTAAVWAESILNFEL